MKKLFKPLILVALLCIVIVGFSMALVGCDLFSQNESHTSFEFTFQRYAYYGGDEGYSVSIKPSRSLIDIVKIENIPTEYDGKPVIRVMINGTSVTDLIIPEGIISIHLADNRYLKNVTLPTTLREIDDLCFVSCTSLESITVPDNVQRVGGVAFGGCKNLTQIKLPISLTDIDLTAFGSYSNAHTGEYEYCGLYNVTDNWSDGAFYLDKHLIYVNDNKDTSFTVRPGTTTICSGWRDEVKDRTLLESIDLPKSISCIGDNAFGSGVNDSNIKHVYFGGTIAEWCAITFENKCSNPVYRWATYQDHGTELYCVEDGRDTLMENIAFPFRATTINDYALMGFSCIKSFSVVQNPTSHLKYIGECAFAGCVNLNSITLGTEIEEIGEYAFDDCRKIVNVRVHSDRYRSYEYTSQNESSWIPYNCIIDIDEKEVIVFTLNTIYIPSFVTSFDTSTLCDDSTQIKTGIPLIRYEGSEESFGKITNSYAVTRNYGGGFSEIRIAIEYNYKFED